MAFRFAYYLKINMSETANDDALKSALKRTVKLMDFPNGHYFILDQQGRVILDQSGQLSVGKIVTDVKDIHDKTYIEEMITRTKAVKNAHVSYTLHNNQETIAYVRYFDAFNWIIGAAINVEQCSKNRYKQMILDKSSAYAKVDQHFFIYPKEELFDQTKFIGNHHITKKQYEQLQARSFLFDITGEKITYIREYVDFIVGSSMMLPPTPKEQTSIATLDTQAIIILITILLFGLLLVTLTLVLVLRRHNEKITLETQKQIIVLEEELHALNQPDVEPTTGLLLSKRLHEIFAYENESRQRVGYDLSFMALSIDQFSAFEKEHGIEEAQKMRQQVLSLIQTRIRVSDTFVYIDDNFFIILLKNAPLDEARKMAENLRTLINDFDFTTYGHITCSFGVTTLHQEDAGELNAFMIKTKEALKVAQEGEGNRIIIKH
jgi:diguanylate cyclase (GGDEF)-like protein